MSEEMTPRPCPFCGELPEIWQAQQSGAYFVDCTNESCPANPMTNPSGYREKAIRKWNKRKTGVTKEHLEKILTEYGCAWTEALADRILEEFGEVKE